MNWKAVAKQMAFLLWILVGLLAMPLAIGIWDGNDKTIVAYAVTIGFFLICSLVCAKFGSKQTEMVGRREALIIVSLIWVVLGFGGALPFLIEGSITSFPAAIFESVSGFTTTGATVISDIDNLSRATNFWRCLMHWIGGMGIVVLFVAIFPTIGIGAKQMFKNESAGPVTEGIRPKIRQSAIGLWWVYALLTAVCGVLYHAFGMNWFDAICHAFSTLGTGGFSTKSASIGYFDSLAIDLTACFFMLVAGLNFGLLHAAITGKFSNLFRNPEFKYFLVINLVLTVLIGISTVDLHKDLIDSVRHSLFQTLAVTSSTGFMTEDFDKYPDACRFALFLAMFIGGCAGSTAGGMKVSRILTVKGMIQRDIYHAVKPREVVKVSIGGKSVPNDVLVSVLVYLSAYMLIFGLCSMAMVTAGYDLMSAMSSVVACLSSIGPGLAKFGPSENFAHAPGWAQMMLCFCMIAGRLEIIVLLAPFTTRFWRR